MEINEEVCSKIEELASKLVPPSQMAALLDLNEDGLKLALNRHSHPARKAFLKGMANTANKIRATNIELAETGSPDAIHGCFNSMREMINELLD